MELLIDFEFIEVFFLVYNFECVVVFVCLGCLDEVKNFVWDIFVIIFDFLVVFWVEYLFYDDCGDVR